MIGIIYIIIYEIWKFKTIYYTVIKAEQIDDFFNSKLNFEKKSNWTQSIIKIL